VNAFVVFTCLLAAATARPQELTIAHVGQGPSTLVRAPAHDSASIESHRLGGNFAFAVAEAHAYAQVTPQISRATFPVAETTYVHEPETIAHVVPAPIVNTHHAARPVLAEQAILAKQAVVGPVAQHTQVHQQVYKQQHITHHQPAPVLEYHQAAPAYAYAPVGHPGAAYAHPGAFGAPFAGQF
jgi:hypothetical protein